MVMAEDIARADLSLKKKKKVLLYSSLASNSMLRIMLKINAVDGTSQR